MEIAFGLLESFMIAGFLLAFNGGRRNLCGNLLFGLSGGILLFLNLMITSYQDGFSEYAVPMDFCILFFWSLIGLKGPWYKVLVSMILCYISLIIANIGSLELLHKIMGQNINLFLEGKTSYRYIELVSGKLLWAVELGMILFIKQRFFGKKQTEYGQVKLPKSIRWGGVWITLLCGVVTVYATEVVLVTIRENKEFHSDYANQVIGVIIGFILLNLVILGLMGIVFWQERNKLEIAATRQMLETQKQSYEIFLKHYDLLQKKQHDLKNALLAGKELMKKKEYDALESTFDQIYKTFLKKEESSKDKVASGHYSGTAMWLALIDYQEQRLSGQNILFLKVIKPGDYRLVEEIDLCVILGNLLDNAIEAVEREEKEKRKISLYMEAQFGAVYVKIKNTIQQSVLQNQGIEASSKKEKEGHGYGIKGVREIAAKYKGKVLFSEEEQQFIAEVLLYTNQ